MEYLYTLYMLYLIHVYIKIGVVIKPWKGKKTNRQTIIHKTQLHRKLKIEHHETH